MLEASLYMIHAMIVHEMATWETPGAKEDLRRPTRSRSQRPRFVCPLRQAPESGVFSYQSSRVHTRPPKAGIFMVWLILIHAIIVHEMATWETAGAKEDRRRPTRSRSRRPHVGHGVRIACLDGSSCWRVTE